MAYDGMVIRWEGRDDAMQDAWTLDRAYQFRWHPSAVLSAGRSGIFTHIINGNYGDLVPSNSYVAGYGCDARVVGSWPPASAATPASARSSAPSTPRTLPPSRESS
jgi:hypothetical protein